MIPTYHRALRLGLFLAGLMLLAIAAILAVNFGVKL